ncbi:MAG: DNA primase, partial [Flavobacteriaceae bacterium]|nr:DNA primase [Flavobacteriaceae bacterium]
RCVSNFSIEVIQHMQDEKFPAKLIRICNTNNQQSIFDTPSQRLNKPGTFDDMVTDFGNYRWLGTHKDHSILKTYLMDRMGTGRKIDVLGWQPEGFWVWNNMVITPENERVEIDDNGIFTLNNVCYYVPSANSLYAKNPYKFSGQKKFVSLESKVSFRDYGEQLIRVHKTRAINLILYSITCMFRDVIISHFNNFPILFLYGPAGTGKDEIVKASSAFFGVKREGINLESGISTQKAQIREFAQFFNSLVHLSEYKKGDHDGMIKGLWDNTGYKRGTLDSHVSNESIPLLSGVILTGNEHPDQAPVITRFIWEEFYKNEFSKEESHQFEILEKMINDGLSSLTNEILIHRGLFIKQFEKKYKWYKKEYTTRIEGIHSRVAHNISILAGVYESLKDVIEFPFNFSQMNEHFIDGVKKQQRKLESSSIINKWWDCFIASLRGSMVDQLMINRDYKLEGNNLIFNFQNAFTKIQRQWFTQFRENSPSKSVMMDALKKQPSFCGPKNSFRINDSVTSGYMFDLTKTNIKDEFINAINWQMRETGRTQSEDEIETEKETKEKEIAKQTEIDLKY